MNNIIITKEQLELYIKNGFSTREIAKETQKSQANICFWLKRFNLKTAPKFKYQNDEKLCKMCQTIKPIKEFYLKRDKKYPDKYPISYCITCSKKQALDRQRNLKKLAIDYKGGKCCKCGYNKCQAALEFHHIEPDKKDFNLSNVKNTKFNEKIKHELDKCLLLCSNCHKEEHWFLAN